MANLLATMTATLAFIGPSMEPVNLPVKSVSAPYQGLQESMVDLPDLESARDHDVSFGSVAAATCLRLENGTGQDIGVRLNTPPQASGALIAGLATIALVTAAGDRLSVVTGDDNGGTPGAKLSVARVDGTSVAVASFDADNALQTLDVSDVVVRVESAPHFGLAPGGMLVVTAPVAATLRPLSSASAETLAAQTGAGRIAARVFGDPT